MRTCSKVSSSCTRATSEAACASARSWAASFSLLRRMRCSPRDLACQQQHMTPRQHPSNTACCPWPLSVRPQCRSMPHTGKVRAESLVHRVSNPICGTDRRGASVYERTGFPSPTKHAHAKACRRSSIQLRGQYMRSAHRVCFGPELCTLPFSSCL